MRIRLLVSVLSAIIALNIGARSAVAQLSEADWGARVSNGIGNAGGTPLPNGSGDLIWIGHFTLTNAQIAANATNPAFLLSNFVIYASSFPGENTPGGPGSASDGYWLKQSQTSTASAGTGAFGTLTGTNIQNTAVYYWIWNQTTTTVTPTTQYGIFTDPAGANGSSSQWIFPSDNTTGNVIVPDLSNVPHDASGILWGSYGTGTSRDGSSPLYNLALIPEPSTLALLGVGIIGIVAIRRRCTKA
jgi:hypothetical protein